MPPWPRAGPPNAAIAKALGISQPTVSQHQSAAIGQWAALPWLGRVRDELVTVLSEQGRVMTAAELAAELRVRHAPQDVDDDTDRANLQALALAVVRAAVEAESRLLDEAHGIEHGVGDGEGSAPPPRIAVLRRGGTVLLALEDLPGSDDPTPVELADHATELGHAAQALAARDPLPGKEAVLRELRAVPAPEGMAPPADTRLVALAASMAAWCRRLSAVRAVPPGPRSGPGTARLPGGGRGAARHRHRGR